MKALIIFLFACLVFNASGSAPSYKQCQRYYYKGHMAIGCMRKGFTSIPTDVPKDAKSCYFLLFQNNKITTVPAGVLSQFANVARLYLYANRINVIQRGAFKDLTNLKMINLGGNFLKKINRGYWEGVQKLEELSLYTNHISDLGNGNFSGLPNLKALDLGTNRVKSITDSSFVGLTSLERLDLRYNALTKIENNAFDGNPRLKYLDISGQASQGELVLSLKTFEPFIKKFQDKPGAKPFALDISRTNFKCTCQMYWLVYLINKGKLPDGRKFDVFRRPGSYYNAKCGSSSIDDKAFFQYLTKKCVQKIISVIKNRR